MSQQTTTQDRKLPITQIDELWAIAETRWGSAGRRTPPPDPRFKDLREHLGKIESLFKQDKEERSAPIDRGFKSPKRKMVRSDDDEDYDIPGSDEIPF